MAHDLLILNGAVVSPAGEQQADVAVKGERIVALEPRGSLGDRAKKVIDASGCLVVPGGIPAMRHLPPTREQMSENKAALVIRLGDEALAWLVASAAEQAAEIVLAADRGTNNSDGARYMTVPQAAEYTRIPKNQIYKLVSGRRIPHARKGKRIIFDRRELDAWIEQDAIPTRPSVSR